MHGKKYNFFVLPRLILWYIQSLKWPCWSYRSLEFQYLQSDMEPVMVSCPHSMPKEEPVFLLLSFYLPLDRVKTPRHYCHYYYNNIDFIFCIVHFYCWSACNYFTAYHIFRLEILILHQITHEYSIFW